MGIKFRLIAMNFLQYAIWGSWLISLGAYLGGGLDFSGLQIGSFFATMGIASLFMPAVMGIIADRWIPAQKLLGICHFISGAFLIAAASQTAYAPLYSCMLLSVMFYMPTIALSNSVAYNALDLARLDTVKHFPPIRVWGTVGFIAAMWFVDLTHIGGVQIKLTEWQLYVSALLSFVLAADNFSPNHKTRNYDLKSTRISELHPEAGAVAGGVSLHGVQQRRQTCRRSRRTRQSGRRR